MKLQCYSLFDTKAAAFGTPFFMFNDQVALRAFGDLTNDPQSNVHAHPEDYILYCIGEFDDKGAEYVSKSPPAVIANASSLVKVEKRFGHHKANLLDKILDKKSDKELAEEAVQLEIGR